MSGTAKKIGGADLGISATKLQAEEGRGCGRECDSQLIGKATKKTSPPQLRRQKIARFTQHVVNAKAAEIMCMYIEAKPEAGLCKMEQVDLSLSLIHI